MIIINTAVKKDNKSTHNLGMPSIKRQTSLLGKVALNLLGLILGFSFLLTSNFTTANILLDASFGNNAGFAQTNFSSSNTLDQYGRDVVLQTDGKLVVAGSGNNGENNDFVLVRYNTDGSLDGLFGENGMVFTAIGALNDDGYSIIQQSDEKLVVAGSSVSGDGDTGLALARYNTDGSLDTSFGGDGKVVTTINSANSYAYAMIQQDDNKLVVAGSSKAGLYSDFIVARYNEDGSLDNTFGSNGTVITQVDSYEDTTYSVIQRNDGKLLVVGKSNNISLTSRFVLALYNSDGSLDLNFGNNGKVVTAIGTSSTARSVVELSSGKLLVVGISYNGSNNDFALARYNSDGSLDSSFDGDGIVTTAVGTSQDFAESVIVQSDGKLVVSGYSYSGSRYELALVRYNTDGSLDTSFDSDGKATTIIYSYSNWGYSAVQQSDGKLVMVGSSSTGGANVGGSSNIVLVRFNTDGSLDTSFDSDGKVSTSDVVLSSEKGYSVIQQANGQFVMFGSYKGNLTTDFALTRFNIDGSLDASFDSDGKAILSNKNGYSFIQQNDNKFMVVSSLFTGSQFDIALYRLNSNGSLDLSFDSDGIVTTAVGSSHSNAYSVIQQSDNKIVVAGKSNNGNNDDFALVRYNVDGSLDSSFDTDGKVITDIGSNNDIANVVIQQSDGKLVAAGLDGYARFALTRYNIDGSLDTSFDGDGKVIANVGLTSPSVQSFIQQSDGKLVVAGYSGSSSARKFTLLRYNSDGSLDISFDSDGIVTTAVGSSSQAYSVIQQTDGKLVLAGNRINGSIKDLALVRYNTDGSLDASFGTNGIYIAPSSQSVTLGYGEIVYSNDAFYLPGYADGDFILAKVIENFAPDISINNSNLTFIERSGAMPIDSTATLSDSSGDSDWNGGTLVIQITANNEDADVLSIPDNQVGNIHTVESNILDDTTIIGTLSALEGTVTNGTALTITFNSNATNTLAQQVLQSIHYHNASNVPSSLNRTVTFTATDKYANSNSDTRTIAITLIDPIITSVSIDNSVAKVGDAVNVSIVAGEAALSMSSGNINGVNLSGFTDDGGGSYHATYTVVNGGADVAASSDVSVSLILQDSGGNNSNTYTTAISQANDAIYSNVPTINLTSSTNTINEDGGMATLTAALSNSLNNQWPQPLTVSLSYTGTATAGVDYGKSNSIIISANSSSNSSLVTSIADTFYDALNAETIIVDMSVSIGNEGVNQQQIITIADAESAPVVSMTVSNNSITEDGGTSIISASIDVATFENVTVGLGYSGTAVSAGTDYNTASTSIVISAGQLSANATTGITAVNDDVELADKTIVIDIASVLNGGAMENGVQQQTIIIVNDDDLTAPVFESATPSISSITRVSAALDIDLDENGTVYYVVVGNNESAPTITEVIAGKGAGNSTSAASGNIVTSATTGNQVIENLSSNTEYDIYLVAQDINGTPNVQSSVTKVDLLTLINNVPIITLPSAPKIYQNDTDVDIDAGLDGSLFISDDDADIQLVSITVTGGTASISTGGVNITTGDGTDDVLIILDDTMANINTALNGLAFTPDEGQSGRLLGKIQIQSDDGFGGLADESLILPVNDTCFVVNKLPNAKMAVFPIECF